MPIPNNSAEPIVQIVFNNSLISFPLFSVITVLLLALLAAFIVASVFLKKLPEHIYNKAIKKYEIIASQLEPAKIDAYIKLSEHYGEVLTGAITSDVYWSDEEKRRAHNKFSFEVISKLFFFASDETINKYLTYLKTLNVNQYAEMIVSMRKELHKESKCTPHDVMVAMYGPNYKTSFGPEYEAKLKEIAQQRNPADGK